MSIPNHMYGYYAEKIVANIFAKSGYEIESESEVISPYADITAHKNNITYFIEVKAPSKEHIKNLAIYGSSIQNLYLYSKENNAVPILIVLSRTSEESIKKYCEDYPGLIILDLANILYAINGTELQSELVSLLLYSIDDIVVKKGNIDLGWSGKEDIPSTLLTELKDSDAGKEGAVEFEKLCYDVLKYIFSDDLSLWKTQERSNDNLYRFDLLCRIKDNNLKTFWTMMETYFHSKYIIFEFKNYKDKITQKEIYTTERYLYSKALRNVAIIIARSGFDENSVWAAKGCLRENGKLIFPITVTDLIEMYEMKVNQDDPSEFLLNKIDSFLAQLEK